MSLTNFVSTASRAEVLDGLRLVKSAYLPQNMLIDPNNRLGTDSVACVEEHFNPNINFSFTADDGRTYLASSAYMHCFDGWQYLSHAIDSILKGDYKTCVHLSYYAELRAAMSFLASEGIGIFSNVHFCQNSGRISEKDPFSILSNNGKWTRCHGTHKFVWECLDEWINQPNKSTINLLRGFSHNGLTFNDWIQHIPHANSINIISLVIKDWLRTWTFDIQKFLSDRNERNNASYRPNINSQFINQNIRSIIDSYSSFLSLTEPSGSNRFVLLDKHLFKILFDRIYSEIQSRQLNISKTDLINNAFQNARKPIDQSLRNIINSNLTHPIFTLAQAAVANTNSIIDPLTIFSRALLMLRIASGSVSVLFQDAAISRSELVFFTDYFGVENGFWKPGDNIQDFEELWADINDAITDISTWLTSQTNPLCLKHLNESKAYSVTNFKQINRASLWGIAI